LLFSPAVCRPSLQILLLTFGLLAATGQGLLGARLIIKGSDTLGAKLVPQLAEVFDRVWPEGSDLVIEIAAEGSATGIASVLDGTADIGMLSRPLRPDELAAAKARGLELALVEVARDALVVIIHQDNPLREISLQELAAIYTGDVINWAALSDLPEPISAYSRNSSSGSYVAFQQLALNSRDYSNQIKRWRATNRSPTKSPATVAASATSRLPMRRIRAFAPSRWKAWPRPAPTTRWPAHFIFS